MAGESKGKSKFYIIVVSLLAIILVAGLGFVGYQIKSALDREIYGTPRGEVGEKDPSDLGLDYETIEFTSSNTTEDDLTIHGWFIDGSSDNCIILAPGKGQSRWKLFDYIPFLHEAGYDLLMFDPQGTGKSEGKKWAFGYFESRDIINGVKYLEENHQVESIGILGRSAGATAGIIAALESEKVDAVVADSPFASIKLASESYGGYENNPLFDILFPLYGFGANWMLDTDIVGKTDLTERISNLETPVFFIHGDDDQALYPKNSKVLYENKQGQKELWTPEGIGHVGGFEERPEEYKKKVLNFFEQQL
ncbi:alpha/beta fold hydrolase [Candidatus Bipolaricaulota bacterium]|nr:alpha/beta fold hydrolase [Candidatus Bipolaricaulota bacterium]